MRLSPIIVAPQRASEWGHQGTLGLVNLTRSRDSFAIINSRSIVNDHQWDQPAAPSFEQCEGTVSTTAFQFLIRDSAYNNIRPQETQPNVNRRLTILRELLSSRYKSQSCCINSILEGMNGYRSLSRKKIDPYALPDLDGFTVHRRQAVLFGVLTRISTVIL